MIDQIKIGNKYSYDDFDASVRERKINKPAKKSIKETVPFSNSTYDFSAINGEIYWEESVLEYVLEITALTPEELEEKTSAFSAWVMNVMQEELHDPFVRNYHYKATFYSIDIDDTEIEKATITVIFTAYPYKISNEKSSSQYTINSTAKTIRVQNNSSHRIIPTFISNVDFSVTKGSAAYTFSAGTVTKNDLIMDVGENAYSIKSVSGSGTLKIEFYEEVF